MNFKHILVQALVVMAVIYVVWHVEAIRKPLIGA